MLFASMVRACFYLPAQMQPKTSDLKKNQRHRKQKKIRRLMQFCKICGGTEKLQRTCYRSVQVYLPECASRSAELQAKHQRIYISLGVTRLDTCKLHWRHTPHASDRKRFQLCRNIRLQAAKLFRALEIHVAWQIILLVFAMQQMWRYLCLFSMCRCNRLEQFSQIPPSLTNKFFKFMASPAGVERTPSEQ